MDTLFLFLAASLSFLNTEAKTLTVNFSGSLASLAVKFFTVQTQMLNSISLQVQTTATMHQILLTELQSMRESYQ